LAEPIFVDTDNALGSPGGDVDDGFAIAALIGARLAIAGVGACAGNTSAELAHRNNRRLCGLLGFGGPVLPAGEARAFLRSFTGRAAALGPLSHLAEARSVREVVAVGGTLHGPGRWPPVFPHEFNLTFDLRATLAVFHSDVPLTIVPLDVARTLWVRWADLEALANPFGELARRESRRWFRHLLWARQTRRFAIYDLAAAFYLIGGEGMTVEETTAEMRPNSWIGFGRGTRAIRVCTALDREVLWRRFVRLVEPH